LRAHARRMFAYGKWVKGLQPSETLIHKVVEDYAISVYVMWTLDQIVVEIEEAEGSEIVVTISTPVGVMRLMSDVSIVDRTLRMNRVHVEWLKPGALARIGLNAIGCKLLELADVDEIIIQGSARTTGRSPGRRPRPIRFPR
jgi:hypothetical protein